ncbi:helix-turn-helix domain containing protein [Streptomyces sp. 71268]|uniref:TetR/AcrR family transcriptional regulator n=1 Tax=Streptomyces sp. 71268 TaxID=3002640 RepID=UPI0023F93079|nr:helix-turn-helix domain-containing protein [Streptomyces sp. 71268]WEV26198.1 helix-turn-helix domain containing protein [Streptomyces sp. 71268]
MHIQSSHWSSSVATTDGGNGRNTPLRVDAQRNLEHVLRAAREVFGELGYGAPMEDVARRARVGVGTVYRRFPSKDVLVRRIAEEETARLTDQARAALRQEDEPWSALSRFLRTSVASGAGRLLPPQVLRVGVDVDAEAEAEEARVPHQRQSPPAAPELRLVEQRSSTTDPLEGVGPDVAAGAGATGAGSGAIAPVAAAPTGPTAVPGTASNGTAQQSPDDGGATALLEVVGKLVDRARAAGELRADVTVADVLLVIATAAPSLPDAAQQAAASARLLDILLDGLRSRPVG